VLSIVVWLLVGICCTFATTDLVRNDWLVYETVHPFEQVILAFLLSVSVAHLPEMLCVAVSFVFTDLAWSNMSRNAVGTQPSPLMASNTNPSASAGSSSTSARLQAYRQLDQQTWSRVFVPLIFDAAGLDRPMTSFEPPPAWHNEWIPAVRAAITSLGNQSGISSQEWVERCAGSNMYIEAKHQDQVMDIFMTRDPSRFQAFTVWLLSLPQLDTSCHSIAGFRGAGAPFDSPLRLDSIDTDIASEDMSPGASDGHLSPARLQSRKSPSHGSAHIVPLNLLQDADMEPSPTRTGSDEAPGVVNPNIGYNWM
jgi:hypothetical protein